MTWKSVCRSSAPRTPRKGRSPSRRSASRSSSGDRKANPVHDGPATSGCRRFVDLGSRESMEFNVADLVEAAADRVPDREILVCGTQRFTFAQLDARTNRLSHYFQSIGLRGGDHIGIYGFNSSSWIETMLAAYKIRAVPINVNYRYVEEELLYLFDNADLVALVHDAQFGPRIANVRPQVPQLRHFIA